MSPANDGRLAPTLPLDRWERQCHSNNPFDTIDPASIPLMLATLETVTDPATGVSATGATQNDGYFETNTMYNDLFGPDGTYDG
jgi:hypothetical protein